jgi:hypothetical protein
MVFGRFHRGNSGKKNNESATEEGHGKASESDSHRNERSNEESSSEAISMKSNSTTSNTTRSSSSTKRAFREKVVGAAEPSAHNKKPKSSRRVGKLKLKLDHDNDVLMDTTKKSSDRSHNKKRRRLSRAGKKPPRFKHAFLVRSLVAGTPVVGVTSSTSDEKEEEEDDEYYPPQMQYEIVELNDLAFPRLRVEWREDNVCPFCAFQCVRIQVEDCTMASCTIISIRTTKAAALTM